ncbi:hypothetical protein [Mycobacterium paraterrae]|uniref:Uncharacterized protein n=1 Tax=Mycobacterium paraterrae TaxID=577492 RepID=A0ABY3VKV8_9MYCO|nr:hypothetical protein [Mycobacterium paraterrae]UMB70050.1 hypothetical protein MKK62_01445 [Mycobacterium paraterrae]
MLDAVLRVVRRADLDALLALEVFGQISETTLRPIDSISRQVVAEYQDERDRWLENQNSRCALRVREFLDDAYVDVDCMTTATR